MSERTHRSRISKRTVDQARPEPKMYIVWDTELRGFGARILSSGQKTYFVQYRLRGERRAQKKTIGRHGVITADLARVEAKRILSEVSLGQNPKKSAKPTRKLITVAESFDEYISIYGRAHLKRRTIEEYSRAYRLHVVPRFGSMPVDAVERSHIQKLHAELHQNAPVQANRTLAIARGHFSWLETRSQIEPGRNPCRGVRKTREKARQRFLSDDEMARLVTTLDSAVKDGLASSSATLAVQLLLLTGARKMEILTLRWDNVDLDRRQLHLSDSKTGPKSILLAECAAELLRSAGRMASNPYVCTGQREGHHLVDLQKPWKRIRAAAHLGHVRIHDLRHTYASKAAELGYSLNTIGGLLSQKSPQTVARYAHLTSTFLHTAADQIGNAIMVSAPN